jgi:hypothetical protein
VPSATEKVRFSLCSKWQDAPDAESARRRSRTSSRRRISGSWLRWTNWCTKSDESRKALPEPDCDDEEALSQRNTQSKG